MARIKREQDREAKREEVITAARQLFLEEGFEATSIQRLATVAGVAPNTIYWYFKDKDEILVAVLDAEFSHRMNEYLALETESISERILWVVEQLERVSHLVSTVHARLSHSSAISTWHDRFHTLTESAFAMELHKLGIAPERVEALVKITAFTIEGLLTHPLTADKKQVICESLFPT